MSKENSKRKGFTLVEILVVISIITLLSSIVLSALAVGRSKARDSQRMSEARSIQTALELYRSSNGSYPDSNPQDTYNIGGSWPGTGTPGSITLALSPLVSAGNISVIPIPPPSFNTFYGYIGNATSDIGSCGGTLSNQTSYILFFNTENVQTSLDAGIINGETIPNLYCLHLK